MAKKNIQISEDLHQFLLRESSKDENYKNGKGIGDLAESAIMNHFGIDESGKPIIDPKTRKNKIKLAKDV